MSAMRPLIEFLGARWKLGSAVVGLAWDTRAGIAGAALADGTLAIVPAAWEGAPRVRARAEGGMEVVPAAAPPPPAMRAGVCAGAVGALVADVAGGFLGGGADGRLVHCSVEGATEVVAQLGAAIGCVASGGAHRAAAGGTFVQRFDAAAALELPAAVTALAFDPAGRWLAAAHAGGVTLWDGAAVRRLEVAGTPVALGWAPDGAHLLGGLTENVLLAWQVEDGTLVARADCPAAPGDVRLSLDGGFVATSNTGAVLGWRFAAPALTPIVCGLASRVPSTAIACHPRLPVVAAGYANGAVTLCQPDSADVLFVRAVDGDTVRALGWSAGGALALGTQAGELGVAVLPDAIFRKPRQARAAEPVQ
jgi:hypothetical protein